MNTDMGMRDFHLTKGHKPYLRSWISGCCAIGMFLASLSNATAQAPTIAQPIPTGQFITPTAAKGSVLLPLSTGAKADSFVADGAAALSLSPDGKTMLLLTSGYNVFNGPDSKRDPVVSQQYILLYDISGATPRRRQTLKIPNAFGGVSWRPDGKTFYVGGGVDDTVQAFEKHKSIFLASGKPISLGHAAGLGADVKPQAGGVSVSPSGKRLLVTNYYNDSVSLIDLKTRRVIAEQDLRPGKIDPRQSGVPGGEFPVAVVWQSDDIAYVSAPRDREIIRLKISDKAIAVDSRARTIGEPTSLLLDAKAGRLYAVEDNDDRLAMLDTRTGALVAEPRLGLPATLGDVVRGKGVNPSSLAFGPDGKTLLVTFGGINALAIVTPSAKDATVVGLVPTGWYPSAVATRKDGKRIYVANRKGPPGPNPMGCGPRQAMVQAQSAACGSANQYIFQLEKGGLLSLPTPTVDELASLTLQVADNIGAGDRPARAQADQVMAALRGKIKHVVYIVKENRTYDQVLGDLEVGNGDPSLAILGRAMTPNHHALALNFVTFDNFYDSGEQSSTGWNWSTAARTTDLMERTAAVNYAGRGLSYEAEGTDRDVNVALPNGERGKVNGKVGDDPDLMPGKAHLTSPDGDDDDQPGAGFLWDQALRAGLSVRNYGFMSEGAYDPSDPKAIPLMRDPFKDGRIAFVSASASLAPVSDPYFRGFDQALPDYWRVKEWEREFDQQVVSGSMPSLTLLRISHDHFGDFGRAVDGVNTVQTQMADNDYSLGLIMQKIAASPFASSTLVFVIEDDAQNGADHIDARRSIAYVVGPYVKHSAVVSSRYTTVSMMRTMEDVLGLKPLGLNDALAMPMADAFDLNQPDWRYDAIVPDVLRTTQLPLPVGPKREASLAPCPGMHDAAYWEAAMRGQDFRSEDKLDTDAFNAALWRGLSGDRPQPAPTGENLSYHRQQLLAAQPKCPPS